jgi:hypothetical protein
MVTPNGATEFNVAVDDVTATKQKMFQNASGITM